MRCSADKLLTSWITSPHWWFQSQVQAAAVVKANKVVTLCSVLCCVVFMSGDEMAWLVAAEVNWSLWCCVWRRRVEPQEVWLETLKCCWLTEQRCGVCTAFIYFHFGVYWYCSRVRGRVHSATLDHNDNSVTVYLCTKKTKAIVCCLFHGDKAADYIKKSKFSTEVPE